MDWWKLTIPATPETLDDITARLTALGFDCFQIEDERDFLLFLQERSPHWDDVDEEVTRQYKGVCRVLIYLPARAESKDSISTLQTEFDNVFEENVAQSSWEENWKQYYKPIPIGERLLIQPAWEPLHNPEGRAVFWNNPGLSFGTGLHATTRICLNLLERVVRPGALLLDIGCGSGILSICGLHLGAKKAVAVDIDPLAADIARENARENGFTDCYTSLSGNILEDTALRCAAGSGWNMICTNIVADVILALSGFAAAALAEGGLWLVSGLIDARLDEVRRTLASDGWEERDCLQEDGWGGLLLARAQGSGRSAFG